MQKVTTPEPPLTSRSSQGQLHLVPRAIVIPTHLLRALRHGHSIQGGHFRGAEGVERCVNVPAVEAGEARFVLVVREGLGVEGRVIRVLEDRLYCQARDANVFRESKAGGGGKTHSVQTLVHPWDLPIPDQLDLGLVRVSS